MTALTARPGNALSGSAAIPGDKSCSHRALTLAAMAEGESIISNLNIAEDVMRTMRAVEAFGAVVEQDGERWRVRGAAWIVATVTAIGGEADPARWDAMLGAAKADGDSLGALVECVATGVPAGWGAPVYAKLDAELAAACMGINAVKAVEIGEGFGTTVMAGSASREAMATSGIDGGISSGQPIVVRVGFKPTSSIGIGGRHDPCVGIRGAPVVEAMVALVLADHKLLHRGQCS